MSLTTSEMTPADIAAVTGGSRSGDGMFGDGAWWIIVLFLFAGWGRGGIGGGGGGYGANGSCATPADVRAAVDQQTLISKLDQQTYGLADATYALNNTIVNGFHGVDNAVCNLGYNIQSGFNSIGHQISDCCCTTQRAIDGVRYDMAKGFCDLGNAVHTSARDVIDNQNANSRAILDFLVQDKISSLTAENQSLKLAASQAKQNAYLVNELRPCPVPAYITCNPYATVSNNCGCNSGCGSF